MINYIFCDTHTTTRNFVETSTSTSNFHCSSQIARNGNFQEAEALFKQMSADRPVADEAYVLGHNQINSFRGHILEMF